MTDKRPAHDRFTNLPPATELLERFPPRVHTSWPLQALGRALKWGLVAHNVAVLVDPPRAPRPEIHPLTPAQGCVLLDAARGDRHEALYRVALSLGLRQGEALGLRWADVDLEAGVLHVRQALQRVDRKLRFVPLKTKRSRRSRPLPEVLVDVLHDHRDRQKEARRVAGDRWRETAFVFTSTIGTPAEPRNVTRSFRALLTRAGLPSETRFHDLRHSCASLLVAQGVHPRVIMEILGHSQISVTMNTYAHVLPEEQRAAAAIMDRLFPAQTPAGV